LSLPAVFSPSPFAGSGPTMQNVSCHVFTYAQQLGREVHARALLVYADAIPRDDELRRVLQAGDFPTILVSRARGPRVPPGPQLAAERREGRPGGTLFVLGDSEAVLAQSRSLVLNPFQGHPESVRNVLDPAVEETIKEFAALDGAFVVRDDGVVLSAGTQLVPTAPHAPLPGGLGTRHAAAAGITASTAALAVCVSQSTGAVSIFKSGRLVTGIQRQPAP